MILTELRKHIDSIFASGRGADAFMYCQGYIDGVRKAPRYGVLVAADWGKLNNYITEKYEELYQKNVSAVAETKKNNESKGDIL